MSYTLFIEIPRYLEIPLIDFCETSRNRRQTPKHAQRKAFPKFRSIRTEIRFKAKTIVTSLPRDIYSDRPKNDNIIIKFSLCVIHVL